MQTNLYYSFSYPSHIINTLTHTYTSVTILYVPCSARERHAKGLIYPNGLSSARIHSNRVRLVVFRDDKCAKQQLFDSQSNAENSEVGT